MNMGLGLYQEQTLKLVMTPELRQAITILQFSAIDLMNYLQEQAIENPVIDLQEIAVAQEPLPADKREKSLDFDWKELLNNPGHNDFSVNRDESAYNPLDYVSDTRTTLFSHLEEQLGYVKRLTPVQRQIARYIIGNLDERGYLEVPVTDIKERLGVDLEEAEDVLRVIQHLDPAGVAARSLEECLLLQLEHEGLDDEHIVEVIKHHLVDLANNRFGKIAEQLHISVGDVQRIADLVRTLNPRPGAAYSSADIRYIVPDVTVEKVMGEYIVIVNDSSLPRLSINPFYERMLKEKTEKDEARQFVHEKLNAAVWLAKSLEQRRMTLLRVTQAIVDLQNDFFEKGIHYLKPMTQKDIAERVQLHESTISRATSNKYVQTPRGVFELKYFFTSALSTASGEAASSESVKKRIKAFIDKEDRNKPYSDQKLAELLEKEGVEISRRTVAKYREEMLILSSAKRKRFL
ncbi:RNA polymerase factor sigma-54 [Brevibacillus laterosporus]|uniref:RNA polymerase factor sigma-54 n=1 Tax=Brevibacillus laterosporus TaxID=1465 RepID=UPI00264AFF33|nr:RNA polymerase factor sigma-54 [Brevibacillus laterosporus]MDN9010450.1 RNA polymerase factor sigma-54 [Brevibacillus laterosporus]MDO0941641.1 RNA polymerase factor sigma-54 [Brevibacillus laterosporus]